MTNVYHLQILTLCILSWHLAHCQDIELNNRCLYSANKVIFTCTGLTTDDPDFHGFIKPETRILVLTDLQNLKLTDTTDAEPHPLMSYTIKNIHLLEIPNYGFQQFRDLNFLSIRNSGWYSVNNNTFTGLENLEILDIQNNTISFIDSKAFSGLFSLTVLEMNGNFINTLFSYMFEDLRNLEQLFLEDNNIEVIEEMAFYGLGTLYSLNLSGNKLKVIQARQFNILPELKYLYLSFNKIDKIIGRFSLPNLLLFNASNNLISHIHQGLFGGATSLKEIDLSLNSLRNLTEEPFLDLRFLEHLNIRNNGVNRIHFSSLRNYTFITF